MFGLDPKFKGRVGNVEIRNVKIMSEERMSFERLAKKVVYR